MNMKGRSPIWAYHGHLRSFAPRLSVPPLGRWTQLFVSDRREIGKGPTSRAGLIEGRGAQGQKYVAGSTEPRP